MDRHATLSMGKEMASALFPNAAEALSGYDLARRPNAVADGVLELRVDPADKGRAIKQIEQSPAARMLQRRGVDLSNANLKPSPALTRLANRQADMAITAANRLDRVSPNARRILGRSPRLIPAPRNGGRRPNGYQSLKDLQQLYRPTIMAIAAAKLEVASFQEKSALRVAPTPSPTNRRRHDFALRQTATTQAAPAATRPPVTATPLAPAPRYGRRNRPLLQLAA